MPLLFSYGTLQQEAVQRSTFGRVLVGHPDELVGFEQSLRKVEDPKFVATSGQAHHSIVRFNGRDDSRVPGMVFEVSERELTDADGYEPSGYQRIPTTLASGKQAWVYAEAGSPPVAARTGAFGSRPWVGAVMLLGAFYLVDGLVFGALAGGAASHRAVVLWRLAAWVTSGVVFLAHVVYERLRLGHSARSSALHAALAAALGACALAAAALVHALTSGTGKPLLLALALVAWPAITAVPAFLVALAAAAVMHRRLPRG